MEGTIPLLKALATALVSCLLARYFLNDAVQWSHTSVVLGVGEVSDIARYNSEWHSPQSASSDDKLKPRWSWAHSDVSCSREREIPWQLPAFSGYKAVDCHSCCSSPSEAADSLSCNVCSCWACYWCGAAAQQLTCTVVTTEAFRAANNMPYRSTAGGAAGVATDTGAAGAAVTGGGAAGAAA